VDLAKQESVLKADQSNLARAQQDVSVAQAALAELLAISDSSPLTPAEQLGALGSWPHSLAETSRAALDYRKVIEQKLMDVKINEAQAQIELATYRPTIQLVNSWLWTKAAGFTGQGPPWVQGARSDLWDTSALLQLSFTGFDGGQARMNAEAARRKARAAEASYQAAVNQVRKEVQTFYAQATQGRDVVLFSSGRVKAANEALRLQTLRFNAGYGTVTDVVQAQQDLTQAVIAYVNDLADYNIALVSLARASGLNYMGDPALSQELGTPLNDLRLPARLAKLR
jgi:outer membrane protein TolC